MMYCLQWLEVDSAYDVVVQDYRFFSSKAEARAFVRDRGFGDGDVRLQRVQFPKTKAAQIDFLNNLVMIEGGAFAGLFFGRNEVE